jgi:hypothetical protein
MKFLSKISKAGCAILGHKYALTQRFTAPILYADFIQVGTLDVGRGYECARCSRRRVTEYRTNSILTPGIVEDMRAWVRGDPPLIELFSPAPGAPEEEEGPKEVQWGAALVVNNG